MKKTKHFFFFLFLIFPVTLSAQENEGAIPSSQEQSDSILSSKDIAVVKEAEKHVQRASQAIEQAKAELVQEKVNLTLRAGQPSTVIPPVTPEEKGEIVREKLETIEKKEEALSTAESFFDYKSKAYLEITELIEKKLELLDDSSFSSDIFEEEVREAFNRLDKLDGLAAKNKQEINRNKQELKSLNKHIETKKLLINLKGEEDRTLVPTLRGVQERLDAAQVKSKYLDEKSKIISLQKEVLENYSKALAEERWERLRKELFSSSAVEFSLKEVAGLVISFLALGFITLKRKSVITFLKEESRFGSKKLAFLFNPFLVFNWLLLLGYILFSLVGFHSFVYFFCGKVALVWAVGFALILLYKIPKGLVKVFLFHMSQKASEEEKEQEKIEHPYFDFFFTLFAWALFGLFAYFVMEIGGVYYEGIELIKAGLSHSLFTVGDVSISIQLILKAGIIVWLFVFSSRVIANILSKTVYARIGFDENTQYTVSVAIKYLMLVAGCFVGLNVLGVKMTALTVFAGTVGIGIGFGLQDIAKNFISGLIMLIERPVKIGDYIEVGGLPGRVRAILARSTIVDTFDNISVVVPNSEFMAQQVINWSHSDRVTRVKVPVGVAYGSDVELVKKLLLEVASKHKRVISYKKPTVIFDEFGDSSLNFTLMVWTNEPENRFTLKSEINTAIDAAFRANDITIPFPQRDLHFKSSDISMPNVTSSQKESKESDETH